MQDPQSLLLILPFLEDTLEHVTIKMNKLRKNKIKNQRNSETNLGK